MWRLPAWAFAWCPLAVSWRAGAVGVCACCTPCPLGRSQRVAALPEYSRLASEAGTQPSALRVHWSRPSVEMMDSERSEEGGVPAFEPSAAVGLLLIGAAASLCGGWCALSLHEGDVSLGCPVQAPRRRKGEHGHLCTTPRSSVALVRVGAPTSVSFGAPALT